MSPRRPLKKIFVTVGSTQFNELIDVFLDPSTFEALRQVGCEKLTIQYGNYKDIDNLNLFQMMGFVVEMFSYRNSIEDCIDEADLVIAHAGAGTALEVLRKGKLLMVVVNNNLMDNHQEELAAELADNNYAQMTNISNLSDKLIELQKSKIDELQSFPNKNESLFVNYIQNIYKTQVMKDN